MIRNPTKAQMLEATHKGRSIICSAGDCFMNHRKLRFNWCGAVWHAGDDHVLMKKEYQKARYYWNTQPGKIPKMRRSIIILP